MVLTIIDAVLAVIQLSIAAAGARIFATVEALHLEGDCSNHFNPEACADVSTVE